MDVGDQHTVIASWPGQAEFEGGAEGEGEGYGAKQRSEASALIGGAHCGGQRQRQRQRQRGGQRDRARRLQWNCLRRRAAVGYASTATGSVTGGMARRRCGRRRLGGGLGGGSQLPQSFQKEGATLPKQGSDARAFLSGARSVQRPARLCCCVCVLYHLQVRELLRLQPPQRRQESIPSCTRYTTPSPPFPSASPRAAVRLQTHHCAAATRDAEASLTLPLQAIPQRAVSASDAVTNTRRTPAYHLSKPTSRDRLRPISHLHVPARWSIVDEGNLVYHARLRALLAVAHAPTLSSFRASHPHT
jgi:hypothetical protein